MVKNGTIHLSSQGYCDIVDITGRVREIVEDSNLENGIVTVFVPGATGAVTTIEFEGGLVQDFCKLWEKIAPKDGHYKHNDRWGDGNGFSHLRAALLGPSLIVPFIRGELALGTWQQIVFIDFDNRQRARNLVCQVMGE
jgi:secondary thiamine-phosphate synthase enzyme